MSNRRRRGFVVPKAARLQESTATVARTTAIRITEANGATPVATGARRFRARLIAGDVQGTSGFYPASMLKESAGVFRSGLPVFIDHPTATEEVDRSERSVRDLAGRLTSAATYQGDGLYADIEVYPHFASVIEAMRDAIGMSIRASGTAEYGQPDGQRGPLITSITAAESVDFVTAAGAGGKIVALLESARNRGLREATTAVTRDALNEALEDAYADDRTYVWVRDFDPDTGLVWYDVSSGGDCDTWQQAYTISADAAPVVTLAGTPVQVVVQTTYTRTADPDSPGEQPGDDGDPAGGTSVNESVGTVYVDVRPISGSVTALAEAVRAELTRTSRTSDGAPPAGNQLNEGMPSMSGAQNSGSAPGAQAGHTPTGSTDVPRDLIVVEAQRQVAEMQLTEARTQNETLRTQLTEAERNVALANARAEQAETQLRQVRATEAARTQATTALAESDLPAVTHTRVIEAVTRNVALTDTGEVDTAALTTAVTSAIEAERTYIAQVAQNAGAGTPTGLGSYGSAPLAESADAAAWETETASRLARLAGTNNNAAPAARGR